MKKLLAVFGILGALTATAWALSIERMDHQFKLPQAFHKGIYVTTAPDDDATTTLSNKVTSMLAASATVDFAFTPDGGADACTDSSAITVTGANVNDACIVGAPTTGGSTNGTYTCYVSAADAVKIRHCSYNIVEDPASATFKVRVIGN